MSTLDSLRPVRQERIIDAVADAGIDVSAWALTEDGRPVRSPAANPKYCYEWAFGGDGEPTALCVWHDNLHDKEEVISCVNNLRDLAILLDAVADDRFGDPEVASRSKTQAKRAQRFDLKLQHAFRRQQEVRLILLAGTQRDLNRLGYDSSEVEYRQLDDVPWNVASYDDRTGAFELIRKRADQELSSEERAYERASRVSVDEFADAFADVDAMLTGAQREMLVGHATSPGRTLSMEALAALGGYDSYGIANLQYGKLGAMLADALQIAGLANQVQSFCELSETRDGHGHAQWTLREPAFDALLKLRIVASEPLPDEALVASMMNSEEIADESPTTRRALIEARLGQGAYRRKMLRWWGNACAVTGCSVEAVLVASHAVPWRDCSSRERLDHFNGLLLTGTLDRLFDAGLIGFSQDGSLLMSPRLMAQDRMSLGLSEGMRLRKVSERLMCYLDRHRERHRLRSRS